LRLEAPRLVDKRFAYASTDLIDRSGEARTLRLAAER
jgi:hypothetical protein